MLAADPCILERGPRQNEAPRDWVSDSEQDDTEVLCLRQIGSHIT